MGNVFSWIIFISFFFFAFTIMIFWSFIAQYLNRAITRKKINNQLQQKGYKLISIENINKPVFIEEKVDRPIWANIVVKGYGSPYIERFRKVAYKNSSDEVQENCVARIITFISIPTSVELIFAN
ncbi:MAG TPA: hypothetical protein VGB95_07300 [Chitinophagales bacterium]